MDEVERVARALCETDDGGEVALIFAAIEHRGDCTKEPFTCAVCQKENYTMLAQAAIAALRAEPDPRDAVVEAARKLDRAFMSAHALPSDEDAGAVLNAMWIDLRNVLAALDRAQEKPDAQTDQE